MHTRLGDRFGDDVQRGDLAADPEHDGGDVAAWGPGTASVGRDDHHARRTARAFPCPISLRSRAHITIVVVGRPGRAQEEGEHADDPEQGALLGGGDAVGDHPKPPCTSIVPPRSWHRIGRRGSPRSRPGGGGPPPGGGVAVRTRQDGVVEHHQQAPSPPREDKRRCLVHPDRVLQGDGEVTQHEHDGHHREHGCGRIWRRKITNHRPGTDAKGRSHGPAFHTVLCVQPLFAGRYGCRTARANAAEAHQRGEQEDATSTRSTRTERAGHGPCEPEDGEQGRRGAHAPRGRRIHVLLHDFRG